MVNIPGCLGSDSFVEPGVDVHISVPISFVATFQISLSAPGTHFLKAIAWMHLCMSIVHLLCGYHLTDGRVAFLLPLFFAEASLLGLA
jgi:hypothetical protein